MSNSVFDHFARIGLDSPSSAAGGGVMDTAASPRAATSGSGVSQFVDQYLPLAQRVGERLRVAPEVLLGQWGLETGWGKSVIPGTNNLGNIKDFSGAGPRAKDNMTGSVDSYRQYGSDQDFGDDFARLLGRRYAPAIGAGSNSQDFFSALKQGGYAEDPDYVRKGVAASSMVASYLGQNKSSAPSAAAAAPAADSFRPQAENLIGAGAPRESAGISDYLKNLAASAIEGFGSVGQAVGEAGAYVANKVTGTEDYEGKNLLSPAADAIRGSMSEGGKQALAESEIKGDISDLGSIELPDTAQGWGMLFTGGLGSVASSMIPFVGQAAKIQRLHAAGKTAEAARAAAVLKGSAAAYGGAMTGGAAAEEVRNSAAKTVAGMTHEQLMAEVPAYAESFSSTGDEQQARQAVVNYAARAAGLAASAFGAAGGAFNAKIIEDILLKKGVSAALGKAGGGVVGRTAIGAGGGTVMEAGQETSEKVGQNIGENVGLGRSALQDATRDTAQAAIGGAMAGGPVGAVAGAASRPAVPGQAPADKPAVPPAVPPQAALAAAKAAEPNSPLSKAAVAGATADAAAQAAAPPPATPADPILERAAQIKTAVQQGGLLDALRLPDAPVDTKQFLGDLATASSPSTSPALREQAIERLDFALGWANQNVGAVPAAPGPMLDQLPGVTAGNERPAGPRPTIPQLQAGVDRDAKLIGQRDAATTEFDRQQVEAQRQVNLERRMRGAPAQEPARERQPDEGIAPTDQYRLEAASMAGEQANRRREDEPRQIVIDRALRNVEERGGVASPQEAQIFAEAGIGRPYDRIDESLGPKPDLVIPRMELAGPQVTESGIILADGGFRQRDPARGSRLDRMAGREPDTERGQAGARSFMQGDGQPSLPGIVNVNQAGQAGATPDQNRIILSGDQDLGTELARRRIAEGYVAPRPASGKKGATKSEERAEGPYTQVQAPRVTAQPGEGPAFLRRRRAMLDQMVGAGFETVERREDGFYLRNAKSRQELKLDGAADAQLARAAIKRMVDARANAAATSPLNDRKEPSWAQIDATNWKKGDRFQLNGVGIVIENPVGSVRRSRPEAKTQWETTMKHHYGDIAGTKGADGDPVDVFIGNDPSSPKIYVVDQVNEDGSFDEHKVMMGFRSEQDARDGYLANYAPGWQGLGAIREMSQDEFQQWVKDRSATAEPASRPIDIATAVDPESAPGTTFTIRDRGQDVELTRIDEGKLPERESAGRGGKGRRMSKRTASMIRMLARTVFGKKVVFFANDEAGQSVGDGFVIPSDPSTIYLREDTTISPLAVFGHELMHILRQENPAAYNAIAKVVRSRVKDAAGFRSDYYGKFVVRDANSKVIESFRSEGAARDFISKSGQKGLAVGSQSGTPLSEQRGGELEELIADLGGDQMQDGTFWKEVFDEIAKNEPAAEAKSAIARLVEFVQRLVARLVEGIEGRPFFADRFVSDHKAIRAALKEGLAAYVKDAGLTRTSMQAEVQRAEQQVNKTEGRIKRAHTLLKKIAPANWTATTDLRDEGVPVLLRTRTSAGAYVTSATEFVDGNESTRNVGGTPPGGPINQMTIGEHHKKVVQRYREMAKLAGIRKSEARAAVRAQTETPEFKRWSGGAPLVLLGEKYQYKSGQPVVVEALHGTTRGGVTEFRRDMANATNRVGAGFYASNSPEDVEHNYATNESGDLNDRINLLADALVDEFEGDMEGALEEARRRLTDGAPNTMRLYMSFKNPAVIGGKGETFFDYSGGPGETGGLLLRFVNEIEAAAEDGDITGSYSELEGRILDAAGSKGLALSDLLDIFVDQSVGTEIYNKNTGEYSNRELFRLTLARLGFDGIIDTNVFQELGRSRVYGPDYVIPAMKGLTEDTAHFVAFEPAQIKSAIGNRGTFDPTDPDIRRTSNRDHAEALRKTGFWGRAGAGAIVISRDTGRVLLPLRSSSVQEPNTWGTWGGAIDPDEDPKQAALRELREEAGISGEIEMFPAYVFQKGEFKYHNFVAVVSGEPKPTLNWETARAEWRNLREMPVNMHPGLRAALDDADSIKKLKEVADSAPLKDGMSPKVGIHFSTQPRTTLVGAYHGSGLKGSEAERLRNTTDSRLKSRVYFYIDEGKGVRPEAGVGGYAHEVKLPSLYDAKADPLRLWNSGDINGTESAILDAGFDGYYVKQHETGQGLAVVIGKASSGMPATRIANPNIQGPAVSAPPPSLSRGLMSREMREINVSAIPGARMRAGILTIPPESAQDANAELERIGSPIRFSRNRLNTPAEEYKAVEEKYRDTDQWLKAPNGARTRLTERQWVQVRTPSFKSWFGDWESFAGQTGGVWNDSKKSVSKAVDENGEPMVVYHGSSKGGFMTFREPGGTKRGDLGIFLAKDEGMAASYVRRTRAKRVTEPAPADEQTGWRYVDKDTGRALFTMRLGDSPEGVAEREAANNARAEPMFGEDPREGDQPGIYALFVNIRDPNEADFEGANWDGSRTGLWMVRDENGEPVYSEDGQAYFDRDDAFALAARSGGDVVPAEDHYETTDSVVREARRSGKDGAIVRNVVDNGGGAGDFFNPSDIFAVFGANQVKSADFNDGSYSLSDDDIRRSVERAFDRENRVSVVVGAKPGEMGWDFTKRGVSPPPFQAPTVYGPRLDKMGESVRRILSSRGFAALAKSAFGITGMKAIPLKGSWLTKPEPSFALVSDSMTYDQAVALSKMIGFAFTQDAMITYQPAFERSMEGTPAVYIGSDSRLSPKQFQAASEAARKAGLDYSTSQDGTALKFLYFGGNDGYYEFLDSVYDVQKAAGLKYQDLFYVRSELHEANDYVSRGDGSGSPSPWFSDSGAGPSGLFGRTVDHLLVPYAKAVGAEGYRFALQRFADLFGLDAQQQELIRDSMIPKSGISKSTVPIASGAERLEIEGRGATGKTPVSAIIYALQNRSAQAGLIEPGDYSDRAMRTIAEAIADEVVYHLRNPKGGKSAIGWYDTALKAAKANYASIFPELRTDRNAEMLFDAIWGITSQGNDVFSNSVFGARVYQIVRGGKASLPKAVSALSGSFGGETAAIENNLLKLDALIGRNGYDAMRTFFNTKGAVSQLNARLRKDQTLFFKGKPLKIDGQADQIVTGWMVFGPKIGSFINNLHGDYSTLTADLWFTRSWNRILGYSFVHAPALEAAQYQKFISALVTERNAVRDDFVGAIPEDFEPGEDARTMSDSDLDRVLTDPYYALQVATDLESAFRKGGYKKKSTLRRAAKVWVENRTQPEAAPRTDLERSFQQNTAELAQKIVRRRSGQKITIADIQAALWFYEKDDLFGPLGGTNKKSEGADYASASDELVRVYRRGNLYLNTTDKRYVYGGRGSYLDTFDPDRVDDSIALMREYDKSPVEGARFQLEDRGADIEITNNASLESRPDLTRAAVGRMVDVARARGVALIVSPKVRRGTKARAAIEALYQDLGFGAPNEDGEMRMQPEGSITRSAERNRAEVESIFDGLAKRGLARKRAQDALESRPDAAIIDYVEKNFLDLLERLEESGKVAINCE